MILGSLRLLRVLIAGRRRSSVGAYEPIATSFKVRVGDLDVLRHMTNGRYLSILDAARMDLYVRSGIWDRFSRNRCYPVVVAQSMVYRKSLRWGQQFTVTTRLIGFDTHNGYFEQEFRVGDETYGRARVTCRYLKRTGGSLTHTALSECLHGLIDDRPLPVWVGPWLDSVDARRVP
ncbi:acyl-CoA thioesterase [Nocardia sp. NPDC003979]